MLNLRGVLGTQVFCVTLTSTAIETMILTTLPETNIVPENGWLEDEFPFGMAQFQGLFYFQGG